MADFKVLTRGNSSPQGKPRVFFTAHPEDHDRYFEEISTELLSRQNCAVFFLDSNVRPADVEDYELRLGEMQLFVVPVTSKLLTTPSHAMDVDVPFAFAHNIPVLPLISENVSGELYRAKFGDLQYLDKVHDDPTAIPYDEKLTKYLASVIVGDELAQQIRAAFSAYVFLSYRKKDRRHAQQLMRLIHADPAFRDIAIWYDEFLTPGEDFNDAIKDALRKSDLFVLTVTPNLLEMPDGRPNFVMGKEYPAAMRSGKPIIPAEMQPTDRVALRMNFPGLPDPIIVNDTEAPLRLIAGKIKRFAKGKYINDPQHIFFIGLAYLSGIDVEIDHERAYGLIAGSAAAGYTPAIIKLISMFKSGEGVKRDDNKAVEWLEKLVQQRRNAYGAKNDYENALSLYIDLQELGDSYYSLSRLEHARRNYQEMLLLCESMINQFRYRKHKQQLSRMQMIAYGKLGNVASAQKKLDEAEDYYRRNYAIAEALAKEGGSSQAYHGLAVSLEKLGDIARARGNEREAEEYYHKAHLLRQASVGLTPKGESKSDLAVSHHKLGAVAEAQGRLAEAERHYRKCFEICETVAQETGSEDDRRNLSISCNSLADILKAQGKNEEAESLYRRSLSITEELVEEAGSIEARSSLCVSYDRVGDMERDRNKHEEAERYYRKSLEIRKALAEETGTVTARRDLSFSYCKLGDSAKAQGKLNEAEQHYRKCLAIRLSLAEATGTIEARSDLANIYERLGDLLKAQEKISEAEPLYRKSFAIREMLAEKTGTIADRYCLAASYERLGDVAQAKKKYHDAKLLYLKSLEIREAIVQQAPTAENNDALAVSCLRLGMLLDERAYMERALSIWTQLSQLHPHNFDYKRKMEIAQEAVQQCAGVIGNHFNSYGNF